MWSNERFSSMSMTTCWTPASPVPARVPPVGVVPGAVLPGGVLTGGTPQRRLLDLGALDLGAHAALRWDALYRTLLASFAIALSGWYSLRCSSTSMASGCGPRDSRSRKAAALPSGGIAPAKASASSSPSVSSSSQTVDNRSVAIQDTSSWSGVSSAGISPASIRPPSWTRSEEHTSELQSRRDLVCRLLLEKKKSNRPTLCLFGTYVCPLAYL